MINSSRLGAVLCRHFESTYPRNLLRILTIFLKAVGTLTLESFRRVWGG